MRDNRCQSSLFYIFIWCEMLTQHLKCMLTKTVPRLIFTIRGTVKIQGLHTWFIIIKKVNVFTALKTIFNFARKIKRFKSVVVVKCIFIYTLLFILRYSQKVISTFVKRCAVTHMRCSPSPRADGGQQLLLHNSTSARERKSLPETPPADWDYRSACHKLVTCFGREEVTFSSFMLHGLL